MVTIFFIYGLSFFTFGIAVLLSPKEIETTKFMNHIWLIGLFGILHGFNEWVDMFKLIEPTALPLLNILNFILLPLSYLFLLYFGLRLLVEHSKRIPYTFILPIIMVLITLFSTLISQSSDVYLASNIWGRYLFGIPGIFLTSYALWMQKYADISPLAKKYFILLSVTFFFYGILSGVITPAAPIGLASVLNHATFQEYFGAPVQLFRALSAFLAAYLSIRLLRILHHKIETYMIQLSRAIEASGDSVVITNSEGIIQYINPAFEQQTGFNKNEAYGQKPSIVKSGIHPISFYEKLWSTILSGETFRNYLINKKKDGELYHEYKAISAIKDAKGNISSFVSTGKDVTERMLLEKKFEQLATTDKLTGIANRLKFDEFLHYSLDRAKRYKVGLSIILFDIDNFKNVNDVYGHICGDDVLKAIAKIGQNNVRKSDLIARWGGEEFMILQPDIPQEVASVLAERIRHAIENYPFEPVRKVTISLGITHFLETDDANSFLKRVDAALYAAKTSGKNKVVMF